MKKNSFEEKTKHRHNENKLQWEKNPTEANDLINQNKENKKSTNQNVLDWNKNRENHSTQTQNNHQTLEWQQKSSYLKIENNNHISQADSTHFEDFLDIDDHPYSNQIRAIKKLRNSLPSDMIPFVNTICSKTNAILQCMKDDQRDIAQGTQFLNRYLPIIQTNLERFIRLQAHQKSFSDFEKIKKQTKQSFSDASYAFSDLHRKLLDNDANDLIIDLNVLDKLIKSDGYENPKR